MASSTIASDESEDQRISRTPGSFDPAPLNAGPIFNPFDSSKVPQKSGSGFNSRSRSPRPPTSASASGIFGGTNGSRYSFNSNGTSGEQTSQGLFGGVQTDSPAHPVLIAEEDNTATFQVFKNPRAEKLLGLIDHLRRIGLSRDVALPELVVTGNQSSGKSSLLESLTGLPFPTNVGTCTRFITKVSIRRAPDRKFKASIISDRKKKLKKKYTKEPSRDEFKDLLKSVSEELGVQESGFSADFLHIEISGPDRNPLSFMDTPGLFVSGSVSQSTEDATVVRELVRKQINSPRAIIVAVMAASENTETQSVWSLAEEVDPKALRTVGVLTKCDRLDKLEQELALEVARNKKKILSLGWWVVKNRSGLDVQIGQPLQESRKEEDRFFSDEKWTGLPRNHVGVNALRSRLEQLLSDHIIQELPKMQMDVFFSLQNAQIDLEALGPARPTAASERQHLINIAELHVEKMKRQLDHKHESADSYMFWNRIRQVREGFQSSMKAAAIYHLGPSSEALPSLSDITIFQASAKSSKPKRFDNGKPFEWLTYRYEKFRGRELPGGVDAKLLSALFKELTEKWKTSADDHLHKIQSEIKECFYSCLKTAVSDDRMFSLLKRHLSVEQEEIIYILKKDVSRHIEHDRSNVSTTNPDYEKRITTARAERIMACINEPHFRFSTASHSSSGPGTQPSKEELEISTAEPRWTIIEFHDRLKIYYDLAAQSVVDNISKQVIDPFIEGEGSPLRFFDRAYVEKMSDADVNKIAAEPPEVVCEREELEKKIQRLSAALKLSAEEYPLGIEMRTYLREMQSKKDANGT